MDGKSGIKLSAVIVLAIAALSLAGCVTAVPLVIADLQTDKVVVQAGEGESESEIAEKAREGCAIHGRIPLYWA